MLGDLAVAGPGARPLGGPTLRLAFAVIVAHRNETTTIDQLVDACWPDGETPKRAEHNVRTYVHRLRTALGEHNDRIETSANGYRIRLEPAETDIDRFEQLAGEAGRLIDTGDPAAALDRLDEAESLWHGRPYAEIRIEYTADGSHVVVGGDDRVTIWNYDTDTWAEIACRVAGRNLTRDEWEQFGPARSTTARRASDTPSTNDATSCV